MYSAGEVQEREKWQDKEVCEIVFLRFLRYAITDGRWIMSAEADPNPAPGLANES